MSASIVLTAPGVLSAPLPGTPILRLSGEVTVLATDAFTGADGTLIHGRATTPQPGRAALLWDSPVGARIMGNSMVPSATPATGFTSVEIPAGEPPATYEASFKIVSASPSSATFIDLLKDTSENTFVRLTLNTTAMTARVQNVVAGTPASLGVSFAFAFGDVLGVRVHPTSGEITTVKNGTEVATFTGNPSYAGRRFGLTSAINAWAVDDFRLVQTID